MHKIYRSIYLYTSFAVSRMFSSACSVWIFGVLRIVCMQGKPQQNSCDKLRFCSCFFLHERRRYFQCFVRDSRTWFMGFIQVIVFSASDHLFYSAARNLSLSCLVADFTGCEQTTDWAFVSHIKRRAGWLTRKTMYSCTLTATCDNL